MGVFGGPEIPNDGLVLALDGANYKSFKGSVATNILNQITYNFGNTDTALFKNIQGSETVNIPSLGYVNSKYVDFYNDYGGGSGNCCPNPFTYGNGLSVSGNTQYTYSIIYKTTSGYTHPNYMYHYEYGPNGYITEYGVHDTGNRTSLGDGWYHAWGQFTTNAAATSINTGMWHYEYATQNRIYVYKAALYAGTYVIPPEHMLNSGEVRGSTVAAGGGWADLTGNVNNGELVNGPTYSSANGGSLSFDGTNDYVLLTRNDFNTSLPNFTISVFVYKISDGIILGNHRHNQTWESVWLSTTQFTVNDANGTANRQTLDYTTPINSWMNLVAVNNSSQNYMKVFLNGAEIATKTATVIPWNSSIIPTIGANLLVGDLSPVGPINGRIANTQIYNRALTAAEISQNFNATRSRYGI